MAWDVETDEAFRSRRATSLPPRSCTSDPEGTVGPLTRFTTQGSLAEVPVVMGVATPVGTRMKARRR